MFEILMLCGFFYAATSFLIPDMFRGSRRRQPQDDPAKKELERKTPGERLRQQRRLSEYGYVDHNSRIAA